MKYYINEEKQTVTAVMEVSRTCVYQYIDDNWKVPIFLKQSKTLDALEMPTKFVGVARCMEGDVFDLNVGKKIARGKALRKYNKSFKKRLIKAYRYFTLLMTTDLANTFCRMEQEEKEYES